MAPEVPEGALGSLSRKTDGRPNFAPGPPRRRGTPGALLALTRQFLAELHPGAAWIRPVTLDGALEQDLGLDSLSRVELAARIERAFAATLPEQTLGGAVTLRDLLEALQDAPRISSATAHAALPARWSEPVPAIPVDAATLVEALHWHARAHPDRVHIVYHGDSGETNISYGDLQRQVDIVATGLQRAGLEPRRDRGRVEGERGRTTTGAIGPEDIAFKPLPFARCAATLGADAQPMRIQ